MKKKVTRIPVDKDSGNWVMVAVRFDYFEGKCFLQITHPNGSEDMEEILTCTDCLDRLRCVELEKEGGMLDFRLTYTVSVADPMKLDLQASLVIIVFTDQKILGCVEVKIPVQPTGRYTGTLLTDRPLTGHIDFVPARDEAEDKRRGRD